MSARLFVDSMALSQGLVLDLPEGAARHAQVLRLQPGDGLLLFNGQGGEWEAEVARMGRREVSVLIRGWRDVSRELPVSVTLAVGMPANDRMDALVEKATELGVAAVQPLVCERSVLRLEGERAAKKVVHWQSVAIAASEQSGRTHVPAIHPVRPLKAWLAEQDAQAANTRRGLLSFSPTLAAREWVSRGIAAGELTRLVSLSGPEGGLTESETQLARTLGWEAVGLGARVLRADTAPLMVLSLVAAQFD